MKKLFMVLAATVICDSMLMTSCGRDNIQPYTGVPLVILDADICSSTDDLFALEMLYRYEEQGKCRLLGVVVDREGEANARFADVMGTYFGHADVPIELVHNGVKEPRVWIDYAHVAATVDSNEQPMFACSINDYSQLPDGWQLYRRLLAAQPDHSVSIVSTGFVTCLAQLLQSAPDNYSTVQLQHRPAHVGRHGSHPCRGGRQPILTLRAWHCAAYRQCRDHLHPLGHRQLPLPTARRCRLGCRHVGTYQDV